MKRSPLKRGTSQMKRSGFKSKPVSKRKTLAKASKQKISTIQKKIWKLLREKAKKEYKNDCYTCGAKDLKGSNCQLGHMWAKASLGAYLKYDMRVLRWQCMRCNIHHGGAGAEYYKRMLAEIGPEAMEELEQDRNVTVKAYDHYLKLLNELENE